MIQTLFKNAISKREKEATEKIVSLLPTPHAELFKKIIDNFKNHPNNKDALCLKCADILRANKIELHTFPCGFPLGNGWNLPRWEVYQYGKKVFEYPSK